VLLRKFTFPFSRIFPLLLAADLVIYPSMALCGDLQNINWTAYGVGRCGTLKFQKFSGNTFRCPVNEEFRVGSEKGFNVVANRHFGREFIWAVIGTSYEMSGYDSTTVGALPVTQKSRFIEECLAAVYAEYGDAPDVSLPSSHSGEELGIHGFYSRHVLIQDSTQNVLSPVKPLFDASVRAQCCANFWFKHEIQQSTSRPVDVSTFFEFTHVLARSLHSSTLAENEQFAVASDSDLVGGSDKDEFGCPSAADNQDDCQNISVFLADKETGNVVFDLSTADVDVSGDGIHWKHLAGPRSTAEMSE
jgi:hypothetical protein